MKDISLKDLLEAGCHFGHKVERWHPKAASFIFGEREGIHIIDLVKTRDGLAKAAAYLRELAASGRLILFVATKRQAKSIVAEAAKRANLPYLTNRWIGGFITNWEEVKKNVDKANRMRKELTEGIWKKFPKHEQIKMEKDLHKLEAVYGGVLSLAKLPDAVFIIDIKREIAALRESVKTAMPVVAVIDTNANPNLVDLSIPANDDAVGSIQYIANYLADAYIEGKKLGEKAEAKNKEQIINSKEPEKEIKTEKEEKEKKNGEKPKKKASPKKLK